MTMMRMALAAESVGSTEKTGRDITSWAFMGHLHLMERMMHPDRSLRIEAGQSGDA